MTVPLRFLMKDVPFIAASFCLLKHDLTRRACDNTELSGSNARLV
jgi:hypothetical protein